jgi:hypothetical protein
MPPVRLRGAPLRFFASQWFKIVEDRSDPEQGGYRVTTVQYVYRFSDSTGKDLEVLSFHWRPDDPTPGMITVPHLHIGPALLTNQNVIRPKDFHHAHIPTGRVSLESIVRLAITEFGVTPLKANWEALLVKSDEAFRNNRTR